jgi:hypothetical protein
MALVAVFIAAFLGSALGILAVVYFGSHRISSVNLARKKNGAKSK